MSNKPGHESYYSTQTSLSHSDGLSLVVGNPGTGVPSTYFGTTDVLLTDESPGLPTTSRLQQVTMGRPPAGFAVLSYDVPGLSFSSVNLLSQYASMIYVTSGTAPFPYLSLPGYLSTLLADVQAVSPTTFSISVASATSSGGTLTGMRTMVYYQGGPNGKGVTPLSFRATAGEHYTVCVENFKNQILSHWDDGLANPCRAFSGDPVQTARGHLQQLKGPQVPSWAARFQESIRPWSFEHGGPWARRVGRIDGRGLFPAASMLSL